MRKKSALLAFLLILILAISGCSGRLRDQERKSVDFRTGTQGLELRFPSNMPTKLFEGDNNIGFILEVRNRGAFPQNDVQEEKDIFQGRLFFGGFDPNIIEIDGEDPLVGDLKVGFEIVPANFPLEGKSQFNNEGGIQGLSFKMKINDLPKGTSFSVYRPKIRAAINYYYQTIAAPTICVDPQPESTTIRDKPCLFTDSIGVGSQGAPVAVTRVDQDVVRGVDSKSKLLYKIFIENVGTGRVISFSGVSGSGAIGAALPTISVNPFTTGFRFQDLDKVDIVEVGFGAPTAGKTRSKSTAIPCTPKDRVRLIDNKGVIFCQFDATKEGIDSAFETPLFIKLKYAYQDTAEIQLEVREAIEFG
ncbi:hypothetical protein HYV84_06590 [Candidatus Woesearchaeota archaeon]|nr:hypothetical protein [Candidatus Woesearchaeota archaeon]